MCAVVTYPCHPLVLFWWMTLHRRIASQFGVYWPNGRALPIVLMTATNWPASWINHWIVQGKCSVVASKCRWNVSFSIVDGNSSSQMKGAANAWFHNEDETAPRAAAPETLSAFLVRFPPVLTGYLHASLSFFTVIKNGGTLTSLYTGKIWFTAKLTWKVLVLIFNMMKNVVWDKCTFHTRGGSL